MRAVKADHDAIECLTLHNGITDARLKIREFRPHVQLRIRQCGVKVGLGAIVASAI
ncbi:Uncharacterised protein [Yersinia enterocolitica]|uniref:Uncharacterized protein n=2 Tax=Yersinia enterocolitica TaxID=630 RepID=A0ABM9SIL6_YEREN|nr:hypothetical protein CH48_3424 [Yersinia enterocolitica]EHB21077.1 hypothetical protein IOK_09789 [Yersinia enterocolitica subsp. palearctica PhRBD_Ye1]CBX71508.1 unknown protein [Yersinia enterocolitica W22703]VEB01399.1 Uncharacterised protein [Yersinia enterocolitica subsp. enterocolitica]VEF79961.1 Uncharacterised protein [Yersinia enterocolitica subsp. palearctica]